MQHIPISVFRSLKRLPSHHRKDVYQAIQLALTDDRYFRQRARKGRGELFSVSLPHGVRAIFRVKKGGDREIVRLIA